MISIMSVKKTTYFSKFKSHGPVIFCRGLNPGFRWEKLGYNLKFLQNINFIKSKRNPSTSPLSMKILSDKLYLIRLGLSQFLGFARFHILLIKTEDKYLRDILHILQ